VSAPSREAQTEYQRLSDLLLNAPIPSADQLKAFFSGKIIGPSPTGPVREFEYSESFSSDGKWERQLWGGAVQKYNGTWEAKEGTVCVTQLTTSLNPPLQCRDVRFLETQDRVAMTTLPALSQSGEYNIYIVIEKESS
jgi:hypothetical protein